MCFEKIPLKIVYELIFSVEQIKFKILYSCMSYSNFKFWQFVHTIMKSKYKEYKGRPAVNENFVCSRDNNGWTTEKSHYESHKHTNIYVRNEMCSKHDWRQCSLIKLYIAFGGDHVEQFIWR